MTGQQLEYHEALFDRVGWRIDYHTTRSGLACKEPPRRNRNETATKPQPRPPPCNDKPIYVPQNTPHTGLWENRADVVRGSRMAPSPWLPSYNAAVSYCPPQDLPIVMYIYHLQNECRAAAVSAPKMELMSFAMKRIHWMCYLFTYEEYQ